jgi:glutathione S-transferase
MSQANKKQRLSSASTSPAATSNGLPKSSSQDIELLGAWFCPYAQRAWVALNEKLGVGNYKITEANKTVEPDDHYEKMPLLLECNPNGLVPVIIDRRRQEEHTKPHVIYESLICVEHADEALGGGPTLVPGSAAQRAHARMWADKLNKKICTPFYQLLMKQAEKEQDKAAQTILQGLRDFSALALIVEGPTFVATNLHWWMLHWRRGQLAYEWMC